MQLLGSAHRQGAGTHVGGVGTPGQGQLPGWMEGSLPPRQQTGKSRGMNDSGWRLGATQHLLRVRIPRAPPRFAHFILTNNPERLGFMARRSKHREVEEPLEVTQHVRVELIGTSHKGSRGYSASFSPAALGDQRLSEEMTA